MSADLSLSFHIGCKGHSIATRKALSAIAKHIMMKWKKDKEKQIIPLFDYDANIVQAVEDLYHSEFDESVLAYNAKQKREDRKIQSYSDKVDVDGKTDFATEAILQVGDKDFWAQFTLKEQAEIMKSFYEEMIEELKRICPDFKIANATLHIGEKTYDKDKNFLHYGSPHVHIIGLPVGSGYKRGMDKQISKKKVFTPDTIKDGVFIQGTLSKIQDYLHEKSDELIHKYLDDVAIKRKEEGRPFSYTVQEYKDAKDKERLQKECEALEKKKYNLEQDIVAAEITASDVLDAAKTTASNIISKAKTKAEAEAERIKQTADIEINNRVKGLDAREADLLQREYDAKTDINFFYNNTYPNYKKSKKDLEDKEKESDEKEKSLNKRENELNTFAAAVEEYKKYKFLYRDTVKLYKFFKSDYFAFPIRDVDDFMKTFVNERESRLNYQRLSDAYKMKYGDLSKSEKPHERAKPAIDAIMEKVNKQVAEWEKQQCDEGYTPLD